MLEITNLTLSRGRQPVVSDLSLSLQPGQFLALVGPNGAGKSSLLAAVSGRLPAAKGEVRWFGKPISTWSRRDLARRVALMQQAETTGFDFLVRDYVGLGRLARRGELPGPAEAQVITEAMAVMDVSRFAARALPGLSGGERQRAQMARCLAQIWSRPGTPPGESSVLLLDEPTSALDLGQQARLLNAAGAFTRRGGGCLAVLHDLNLAATYSDAVAIMKDEQIVALGAPGETMTRERISDVYQTEVVIVQSETGDRRSISLPPPEGKRLVSSSEPVGIASADGSLAPYF